MNKIVKYSFSDLYEMTSGISTKKEQAGHGSPFVSFGTVFNNYFLPDELPDLMDTSEKEQDVYSIKENDVLVTRTSETIDELAMSCVALKDYPKATYSGFTKRLRPKTEGIVYSKYLAFYLRGELFRRAVTNNAFMTLRASFNEDIFSFLDIYLPKYKEQVKIGDLFYLIEKKIQLNKKINDNLYQQIQLLFDFWFMQFNFPDVTNNPYSASNNQVVWNDVIKMLIPPNWNVCSLHELCTLKNGINYDKNAPGDTEYKIINVRNISSSTWLLDGEQFDSIWLNQSQAEKYIASKEDIIIARSGTPGATRVLLGDYDKLIFCGFIICCTPMDAEYKNYIALYLKKLEGTSATKTGGSILQNVSQETISSIKMCLPPKETIRKFNICVNKINDIIIAKTRETSTLLNMRNWLLPMLMNGQATIND